LAVARRATLRASDSDREHVADRLRAAAAEGRLLTEELEERIARALRARTYGDLDALTADLPREREQVARRRSRVQIGRIGPAPAVALLMLLPLAFALVMAVLAIVFAMLTAWTVLALVLWAVIGHRRRWYGPRWSYMHRRWMLPPGPGGIYGPRRSRQRSGVRL
jgi:Flp pilus assembly protein TadB